MIQKQYQPCSSIFCSVFNYHQCESIKKPTPVNFRSKMLKPITINYQFGIVFSINSYHMCQSLQEFVHQKSTRVCPLWWRGIWPPMVAFSKWHNSWNLISLRCFLVVISTTHSPINQSCQILGKITHVENHQPCLTIVAYYPPMINHYIPLLTITKPPASLRKRGGDTFTFRVDHAKPSPSGAVHSSAGWRCASLSRNFEPQIQQVSPGRSGCPGLAGGIKHQLINHNQ